MIVHLQGILTLPRFIESRRLGPFDPRVKDVGVVLDLMIHDIDIILHLVKSPITSIEATGVPILSDREDIANARIKFENGCIANLNVSRVWPDKIRKLRIFQPDAFISLDYKAQNLEIYKKQLIENPGPGEPAAQIAKKKLRLRKEEPLKVELSHFIDCVRDGREPQVTGEHGSNALQVAVTITELIQKDISRVAEILSIDEGAPTTLERARGKAVSSGNE